LYNEKYHYATSGIYDNVIYLPSYARVLLRGRWAQGCHCVWYTLQNHQTVIKGEREENTLKPSDLCWCGDLHHNLISENTSEKLLFSEYHWQFSTISEM
jgi:hypothetical protein